MTPCSLSVPQDLPPSSAWLVLFTTQTQANEIKKANWEFAVEG